MPLPEASIRVYQSMASLSCTAIACPDHHGLSKTNSNTYSSGRAQSIHRPR
jgi:hypothetical protein